MTPRSAATAHGGRTITDSESGSEHEPPFGASDWRLTAPPGWAPMWAICARGFPCPVLLSGFSDHVSAAAGEMQEADVFSSRSASMLPAAPMATICGLGALAPFLLN